MGVWKGRAALDRPILAGLIAGWVSVLMCPVVVVTWLSRGVGTWELALGAWLGGFLLHFIVLKNRRQLWRRHDLAAMYRRSKFDSGLLGMAVAFSLVVGPYLEETPIGLVFMAAAGGLSIFLIRGAYEMDRIDLEQADIQSQSRVD